MKKKVLFLLVALMLVFPAVTSAQQVPGDIIDTRGHWAEQDIDVVTKLGLMNGIGTNDLGFRIFAPESTVSRAQLAKVLTRTFQLDYGQIRFIKQPLASDYYQDVANDAWYADDLVMCAINNIFATNGYFSPDSSVSRVEIARSIYRSFNAKGISIPMIMMMPIYNDTNTLSQEDTNAVTFVSNTGIMKGNNDYFRPEDYMTRAELAKVLSRCINLMAIKEDLNGQEYRVPVGQCVTVSLSSNPSTGFSWSFRSSGDATILAPIGNTDPGSEIKSEFMVGQGSRQYWQFKAMQVGTTELELVYARPWESAQPAQVFKVKVVVAEAATPEAPYVY